MQRMKTIFKDALLYFFQIVVYIWPSIIMGNLVIGLIVRILLNNSNGFLTRLTETITCVLVLCAFLFVFAYRRGHKKAEFHYKNLLISLLLALGLQFVYAIILRFNVYTTAGAYFFSYMLCPHTNADDIPANVYIMTMCIVNVFYIAAVIAGEYFGKQKRLQQRSVLNLDEKV